MSSRCCPHGTQVILSGLREQPREILAQMGVRPAGAHLDFADNFAAALARAARAP